MITLNSKFKHISYDKLATPESIARASAALRGYGIKADFVETAVERGK